jgi:hypothetical protein
MKLKKHNDGTCTLQGLTFDQVDYLMTGYFDAINSMIDYRRESTDPGTDEWAKDRITELFAEREKFQDIWDVMLKHHHKAYHKKLGL